MGEYVDVDDLRVNPKLCYHEETFMSRLLASGFHKLPEEISVDMLTSVQPEASRSRLLKVRILEALFDHI